MKVSTIETLFSIRTNLFMLFVPAALRATPTLCALAVLMWASQIVTSFPPGAITVTTRQQASFDTINIPIFNASFVSRRNYDFPKLQDREAMLIEIIVRWEMVQASMQQHFPLPH
jgi:hypothetical protein